MENASVIHFKEHDVLPAVGCCQNQIRQYIAEISNSQLGREISMNPSHIGRLRSGAGPLPKRHEFLPAICSYVAMHIQKDYQLMALQKLTGIGSAAASSQEGTALYLERWLLEQEMDTSAAAGRLISDENMAWLYEDAAFAVR